jgi:hypothetical protein
VGAGTGCITPTPAPAPAFKIRVFPAPAPSQNGFSPLNSGRGRAGAGGIAMPINTRSSLFFSILKKTIIYTHINTGAYINTIIIVFVIFMKKYIYIHSCF